MTADKNKNITAITYNYLNLPQQVTKGTGENIKYIYDASGRKLTQQVYNASNALTKTTDYDGELIYQGTALGDTLKFINHEEGRVVMTGTAPEYQYHLKDHLGNVRTTFTTQRAVDNSIGTFEAANYNTEQSLFLRYDDARVINSTLFDHTYYHQTPPTAGAFSERLSGSANEKTGIARSISVMPGDTVNLTVYAKYVDPTNSNNTAALTQFLAQIIAGTASAGTVIDGPNYSVNGITPFPYTGLAGEGNSTGTGPKAYLNYLVFDRNFVFVNGGYVQVSTAAKEDGTNVPHQQLTAQVIITQPGYVYTYLSNESTSPIEVYFDDFTVQQIKSPVVQQEDFYPFGLSFNQYSREGIVGQNYLFNNKELQYDLGLDMYDFGKRMYMPEIGRWGVMDPLAERGRRWSPYNYAFDNPMRFIDPDGQWPDVPQWLKNIGSGFSKLGEAFGSSKTYSQIGKGMQTYGQESKKIADHVEVKASAGAVVGVKVGKVGGELNLGTKELGTASTANGVQKSTSDAVTKGASVNAYGAELSLETKTTTTQQSGTTVETTVATASASVGGLGVESNKTNTTMTWADGSSARVEGNREVSTSFERGAVVPERNVQVGNSILQLSFGLKIDISIK